MIKKLFSIFVLLSLSPVVAMITDDEAVSSTSSFATRYKEASVNERRKLLFERLSRWEAEREYFRGSLKFWDGLFSRDDTLFNSGGSFIIDDEMYATCLEMRNRVSKKYQKLYRGTHVLWNRLYLGYVD